MKNIVLIGMPGCGKSTVGVVLAKILCMDFVDSDLLIQKRCGSTLQELIDKNGVDGFLEIEADVVCDIACKNTVLATGGSAVLTDRAAAHIRTLGKVVYIRISCRELEARLSNLTSRGVAMSKGETVADLYNERRAFYEGSADLTIDADGMTVPEVCRKIISELDASGC